MKLLMFFFLIFPCFVKAQVVATYTYLKAKKPVKKNLTLKELQRNYNLIKRSTFNSPSPQVFFEDYLRFKIGVETALNEPLLVKTPEIDQQITNSYLRQAFHQELYKVLAEQKLQKQMKKLDQQSSNLSERTLKTLYSKEPEFHIFFIAIYHPINPNANQIQEAKKRAEQIHSQVIKSKKPFIELVTLYSDDKTNGVLNINRSKATILPSVYEKLKSMKENSISSPIRIPQGFVIVRLNKKIPFKEANQTTIKANFFNKRRTELFNSYFDSLKKSFAIQILNKDLVKTL